MFEIKKYSPADRTAWDQFVKTSKNGTFLFERAYMDYHSDRFTDFSLLIFRKGRLYALLPATGLQIRSIPIRDLPMADSS